MNISVEKLAGEWNRLREMFIQNPRENKDCVLICMGILRIAQDFLEIEEYLRLLKLTEVYGEGAGIKREVREVTNEVQRGVE